MKLVYFSLTGQTRRFIKKLDLPAYEIDPTNPFVSLDEPFVLVVPTYDKEITETVNEFLDYETNAEQLLGVAGGGNRNFAELFIYTAKDIARDYQAPLLFAFEFNGTVADVQEFQQILAELSNTK